MVNFSYCAILLVATLLPAKSLFVGDSCEPRGRTGTCTVLSQCKALWDQVQSVGNPMPREIRQKLMYLHCGFEGNEQLVCCDASEESNGNNWGTTSNPFNKPLTTMTESRSGMPPNVLTHRNFRLLPLADCGVSEADRIFGGTEASVHEFPWMALLSYTKGRLNKLSCGGTLISDRYVLTAAHCTSHLGKMKLNGVILGEHDLRKDPDCESNNPRVCSPAVRNVSIEEVITHPGYSPKTLVDDIALLRLSEPADFSLASMKPVCLPWTPELQSQNLEGLYSTVSGWGVTEIGIQSQVLLKVELPIMSTTDCVKKYEQQLKTPPQITNKQLCAGGIPNQDSCGGDSGGPLMYAAVVPDGAERVIQRGIVSYGPKLCGNGTIPGVYTRIAYYMDWILENMRD